MNQPSAPSMNSETVVGSVTPRLWTPPLRELTPETSYGYDLIDFSSSVLDIELDPWQQWLAIHMGELLPDGRPRFRTVLALVARQNGKTMLAKALILYWMALEQVPMVLATSTDRTYAKITWNDVSELAIDNRWIDARQHKTPGEETLHIGPSKYRFAANSRRAGRSLTVHRLLIDEIREHKDFEAWGAATNAMNAVPYAQAVAISNQGDMESVLLDSLRQSAITFMETGKGDQRLGLFEWSAPDGAEPDDPHAIAAANPDLGNRVDLDTLLGVARRAVRAGGEELATYRTEVLCQRVHLMDAAIDEAVWNACEAEVIDLAEYRDRVALCLDIAMDGSHATLVAAAVIDGRTYLDVVKEWPGHGCIGRAKQELAAEVARVKPRVVGWLPQGPAAAMAVDLRSNWAPRGTEVETITADRAAACMGLAQSAVDKSIGHFGDPLLTAHATTAQKLRQGDAWVFMRRGSGAIDAAYAAAGAVLLARELPPPRPPLAVV